MEGHRGEIDYTAGSQGGFDATALGRPRDLGTRIRAVVRLLDADGYTPAPEVVQAMMFWEHVVAGMIGDEPEPSDHVLGPGVPRSGRVAAADAALVAEGFYTDVSDEEPDLVPSRYGSSKGVKGWFQDQPAQWTPWFRAMHEFAWGFHDPDSYEEIRCGVQPLYTMRDIRLMARADFVAARLREGVPAGTVPHEAGAGMLAELRAAATKSGVAPPRPESAAWHYARFLCRKAAERDPRFGEMQYLSLLKSTTCIDEEAGDGAVLTVFHDEHGDEAARLLRRPGEDGEILSIEVPEPVRRKGYGTLALRYALTEGIRRTAPVPDGAMGLFGRHGRRGAGGGYALCNVSWGRCKASEAAPGASA